MQPFDGCILRTTCIMKSATALGLLPAGVPDTSAAYLRICSRPRPMRCEPEKRMETPVDGRAKNLFGQDF